MTDPVRIGGFFANFDTEAVIQQLTFARQGAIRKLDIQTTKANVQKGVIAGIQTSIAALLARATLLMGTSSVTGKKATVTNPTTAANAVTAAASPTSIPGSFTVDVLQLATASRIAGTAISAGIDAVSPLALSNFGITPTNGKFSMATATGGSAVFTIGAQAAQPATLLNASNFFLAPTNGAFTIATATGGSATLTIDTTVQSLQDVVTAINGTATGITASITNDANGRANVLSLTSAQGDITLGAVGDTSNFLAAMNLPSGPAASATVVSSAAFTNQMSLTDVITDINASTIGVTASITNDANGRPNILSLASAQGALSLGNATDTSNFLSATNLLASPLGATRTSTNSIARLSLSAKMDVTTFQGGAPSAGNHSFTINGTTINYNAANDSVTDIINRITSSAAGVTARYDSTTDTVRLQQVKTGTLDITMADDGVGGDLLTKLGLIGGAETLGESAEYKIDGGPTQFSATNTVTTGTGVSLTFSAETGAGTPATVVVAQDDAAALTSVKAFVTEFNKVLAALDSATKADGLVADSQSGVLSGDATLRSFRASLRGLISSSTLNVEGNFSTLGQIGLSFGAVGAAIGSTGSLVLDEAKFQNALTTDPASVQSLLSTFRLGATLNPGGTSSLSSIAGTYGGQEAGTYLITDDGAGNITSTFTPVNGGPPSTQSAVITPNGTNSLLIPGMTLSFGPVLTAGTHTVVVTPASEGIGGKIRDLLDVQAGAGGVMQKRQDRYSALTKSLETQKAKIQGHIDAEMANLRRKFAAMERAQARAQQIQGSLNQVVAQLTANKS
jgi:flagellar capping protein FliD